MKKEQDRNRARGSHNRIEYRGLISALLFESPLKSKKYRAVFYDDGKEFRHTDFGAVRKGGTPYEDYTTHKNLSRKDNYISRHETNEKDLWKTDPFAPATLSRFVLWNKPSLRESWDDYKKRFDIQ